MEKTYVFDYSDDAVKAQREAFTCPKPATFELGRSFQIFSQDEVLFFKCNHQHMCLHARCSENEKQYMFFLPLHTASVNGRQKSSSQKLWTTSSALKSSQSSSQKVNILIKQNLSDRSLFLESGPSTRKLCVCCLSSFSKWISEVLYRYDYTILIRTRNMFGSGVSQSTSCVTAL